MPKLAIILSGGGARAAYQVGVLKALAEITPRNKPCPFSIICGTSAGAINAAALATKSDNFHHSVMRMHNIWSNFTAEQVFRTDALGVSKTGAHWLITMMLGGLGKKSPMYLLDRTPLRKLLEKYIDSGVYQAAIESGNLHALSINATGYSSRQAVSFFHGHPSLNNWNRSQRIGCATRITVDHLMASSAIPFLFRPIKINREFFGDGSIRQTAPISPALHLGADRILVIGNHIQNDTLPAERIYSQDSPSIGEIAGHILNSIFLDSLDADIERIQRINRTISLIPEDDRDKHGISLRQVEVQVISPSSDMGKIAHDFAHELPWTIRALMRGMGAYSKADSSFLSYLLFEKGYCNALIDLGYKDTILQKENLIHFLRPGD